MAKDRNIKISTSGSPKSKNSDSVYTSIGNKIVALQEIVKRTIIATQRYKIMDVFGANELNVCIQTLETIFTNLSSMQYPINNKQKIDENQYITKLQDITNELSGLFRQFGTENIEDLIQVCFGNDFVAKNFTSIETLEKYDVMKRYVHPIGYKVMQWKSDPAKKVGSPRKKVLKKNRIVEDFMIVETGENLDGFDLARTSKAFQTKVYGIKFSIQNPEQRKTLIICGVVDDLMLECLNYTFVERRIQSLTEKRPKDPDFHADSFNRFICCLTLKELLIYDNAELYNRYMGYINQVYLIKQKTISQVTKEFIGSELYGQRTTLIQLLLKSNEHEFQYLAYLLYDLLSNDLNGSVDTQEQTLLFDSLPWNVKKYFRDAMKQTINYTNNLANFDNNKIPLEQQICLMKADDAVKEKAMLKLKEVKAKSEDSGSKARQYLEGLLRIPFGIYKEEPILNAMDGCLSTFNELVTKLNDSKFPVTGFPIKNSYTSMEMRKYSQNLRDTYSSSVKEKMVEVLKQRLTQGVKRNMLISNICELNAIIKRLNIKHSNKICHSGKKTAYMREHIKEFIDANSDDYETLLEVSKINNHGDQQNLLGLMKTGLNEIENKTDTIDEFMTNAGGILDDAVHGHEKAKRQIERIIGQWINGEKTGYCFGFEGPPGVGKTSLAKKGIAHCLTDDEGVTRPFSFIAIGGSSNGSTLDGHNYTYVGSTWGRIVDILMENKCMNPIIFIDELDKVSRTEHGREIIGILTHLIDQTQNDTFQDKYFNGIDLDLSKALFIFSYNDVDAIDRILLDRIHRIKFNHLSLDDKLTITRKYLFPEIYKKMGLEDMIDMSDEVIEYIVEEFTCEPGVRKLKEILFEIVGEINLSILKNEEEYAIPIIVTADDVKHKYLKDRHEVRQKKIHTKSSIGLISGLWANALGRGGVLPIEVKLFPSGTFLDLKLTGMQGDVMKESMSVAKTLSWSLLTEEKMSELQKKMDDTKNQGIHIHVPEGATPKDGPSAGTAITVAMYSLLCGRPIRHDVAITGEMCLQGKVTAIGGLDLKILGGIRAGVKTFIFPKENDKEFDDFMEKYGEKDIVEGIEFIQAETIHDVLKIVFDD